MIVTLHYLFHCIYRVAVEVRRRLKALEDALVSKSTMEEELAMTSQWLESLKEDMRLLNKPIGHQTADAELRIEQLQVGIPYSIWYRIL